MAYLVGNDLISNIQYGFVKGRSTSLQLLQILDKWTDCLENGGQIDAVYTDFEKAFAFIPLGLCHIMCDHHVFELCLCMLQFVQ